VPLIQTDAVSKRLKMSPLVMSRTIRSMIALTQADENPRNVGSDPWVISEGGVDD
jgi:hypothetical protein